MSEQADIAAILADYVPRADYEEALAALTELEEDRNTHRTAADDRGKRLEDLEKKYRGRSYRDAFEKVRKAAKVKDEMADDAFRLLGLEQDEDDPDEAKISRALDAFLKERKHYITPEESPRDARRREQLEAGEGATRGASGRPGDPEMRVSYKQLNDASWMRDNQGRMLEAQRAGLLRIDD